METRVKVAVQRKGKDVPGWPCINYDYEKELKRVMDVVRAENPETAFDVAFYTAPEQAQADYEEDCTKYDGVLLLLMTNWIGVDRFYIEQSRTGLPVIAAGVPFCGDGAALVTAANMIRDGDYPVPLISSRDYRDVARAARLFYAMKRLRESKILVVNNTPNRKLQERATEIWGCSFVNMTSADLMRHFTAAPKEEAEAQADRWIAEAAAVREPSREDVVEGARVYLALEAMKAECGADAVTVHCLGLSYGDSYGKGKRFYPCLAFYQMNNDGEIGVCEADIHSTIISMLTRYLTGRPGYVSDPVIDTSSNQIIYAHCVAPSKVFGQNDPRTAQMFIRSHAEDKKGASVQVIFPEGEKLTTVQQNITQGWATVHSSVSCGNVGGDNGCRSKLAATCNAEAMLHKWMPLWHRVTVFGDYRREMEYLFRMKGFRIIEEDKE